MRNINKVFVTPYLTTQVAAGGVGFLWIEACDEFGNRRYEGGDEVHVQLVPDPAFVSSHDAASVGGSQSVPEEQAQGRGAAAHDSSRGTGRGRAGGRGGAWAAREGA